MSDPRLAGFPQFAGLGRAETDALTRGLDQIDIAAGELLFLQGDQASRFFLLKDGFMKATQVTADGQRLIVRIVYPGELFGFAPALQRDTYPCNCEAIIDSTVLAWPRDCWGRVLGAAPAVTQSIVQAIGRKLDDAHARLREMTTEEAAPRIARLLLRLQCKADSEGAPAKAPAPPQPLPYPLTRQDIADMTGTTLHTVSRTMAAWQAQGILGAGRRKVIIADRDALQALAAPEE